MGNRLGFARSSKDSQQTSGVLVDVSVFTYRLLDGFAVAPGSRKLSCEVVEDENPIVASRRIARRIEQLLTPVVEAGDLPGLACPRIEPPGPDSLTQVPVPEFDAEVVAMGNVKQSVTVAASGADVLLAA